MIGRSALNLLWKVWLQTVECPVQRCANTAVCFWSSLLTYWLARARKHFSLWNAHIVVMNVSWIETNLITEELILKSLEGCVLQGTLRRILICACEKNVVSSFLCYKHMCAIFRKQLYFALLLFHLQIQ